MIEIFGDYAKSVSQAGSAFIILNFVSEVETLIGKAKYDNDSIEDSINHFHKK